LLSIEAKQVWRGEKKLPKHDLAVSTKKVFTQNGVKNYFNARIISDLHGFIPSGGGGGGDKCGEFLGNTNILCTTHFHCKNQ